MSDTPRTDAERIKWGILCKCSDNPIDFARTLERELNKQLERNRLLLVEQAHEEVTRSRMMESGLHVQNERDKLRAEVERLRDGGVQRLKDAMAATKDQRDQWRDLARELAQELGDNLAPGLPSSALDRFAAMEKGTP